MDSVVGNSPKTAGQAERLKPYRWKKGVSGNPSGRPKNPLKKFTREYFERMTEEEKIEFLESVSPELTWRMAEGNPDTRTDITSGDEPIAILGGITKKNAVYPNDGAQENTGS